MGRCFCEVFAVTFPISSLGGEKYTARFQTEHCFNFNVIDLAAGYDTLFFFFLSSLLLLEPFFLLDVSEYCDFAPHRL